MTRSPEEPPGWVLAELGPILRLATVLTGSTPGAVDLVAQTLARDRSWVTASAGFDLTPRLLAAVVRTFLGSPLGRSAPIPGGDGLDALPGPTRAAVVLRDAEHLTGSEIVSVLDRPGRRIGAELSQVPPGRHDAEIAELAALAPAAEQVASRVRPALRAVRRTRRRRRIVLTLAAVLAVGAVVVPTIVLPRLPVDVRQRGVWRYSHEVVLAPGWTLLNRSIEPTTEESTVEVPWITDRPPVCQVLVRVRGLAPERDGEVRRTTDLHGRPAETLTRPGNDVSLSWEYAAGAWASVSCDAQSAVSEGVLREVAAATRFRDVRQRLPFLLTGIPQSYRITSVAETLSSRYGEAVGPTVLLRPPDDSFRPIVVVGAGDVASSSESAVGSCPGPARSVCVFAYGTDDQLPANPALLRAAVATTVPDIRLAPDPTDRSTWLDAVDLPS